MGKIWFTSDLHFNHNKEFLYKPRGFDDIESMNETVVNNWNSVVEDDDIVYCLGDLSMGDITKNNSVELIEKLKGHIIVIVGNHDTDKKISYYEKCKNIENILYAYRFRHGKRHYWLSHYPTITSNPGKEKPVWCLSGHTHTKEKFDKNYVFNYNVALDAHSSFPVSLDEIESDIKEWEREYKTIKGDEKL